jgi:hypothetical protein
LLTAVAARDKYIPTGIGVDQAVQAESTIAFHQNNISAAQVVLGSRLHINRFSIADRGRHAGSARLKANPQSGLQAFAAEGFKLPRLRTVFRHQIRNHAFSNRPITHGN